MTGNLLIAGIYMAGGLALFLLGMVIYRENPGERVNRVTGIMMFFGGLGPLLGALGAVIDYFNPTGNITQTGFFYNFFYLWEFFFPQLVFFSLIYPREHHLIRRFPRIWIWIFLPHLSHLLIILAFSSPEKLLAFLDPSQTSDRLGPLVEALLVLLKAGSLFLTGIYHIHVRFFSIINLVYIIAAIILMSIGYKALQDPLRKRQAHTVLLGVRLSVGLYALAILVPYLAPYRLPPLTRTTLVIIALLTGAGSIAWGIVRYQFLGLRSIVRQSIVYSATAGLLLGTYLIIIRQLDRLLARSLGVRVPYLDIAFVVIAVIFFQPVMTRLEQLSERIFRRERSDYRNIIQRLTRDIISIFEIEQLQKKISSTLQRASLTDRTTLLLREEGSDRFCAQIPGEEAAGDICFHRNGRMMRLMASVSGPTSLKEIDVFLEEEDRQKLARMGAMLLIPISHKEELLGALCLGHKMGARRYNFEDVAMLSVLTGQIAIALVNARLYQETLEKRRIEEELATAREIQVSLLPKTCPSGEGFIVSAMNKPSRWVGGDYHDFALYRENTLGMAIGDVSGKGMPAALLMAVLQASFNAQVQNGLPVRETVSRINAHIAKTTDIEKFVTFFYGELDLKSGQFTYSNAGHNAPLLIRSDDQVQELTTGGLILGFMDNAPYDEETVPLEPGDTLFLYTDGIIEAQNRTDEEFGTDRLVQLLLDKRHIPPDELLGVIFQEVDRFSGGALVQQDDSTMVVLQLGAAFGDRGQMT